MTIDAITMFDLTTAVVNQENSLSGLIVNAWLTLECPRCSRCPFRLLFVAVVT